MEVCRTTPTTQRGVRGGEPWSPAPPSPSRPSWEGVPVLAPRAPRVSVGLVGEEGDQARRRAEQGCKALGQGPSHPGPTEGTLRSSMQALCEDSQTTRGCLRGRVEAGGACAQ